MTRKSGSDELLGRIPGPSLRAQVCELVDYLEDENERLREAISRFVAIQMCADVSAPSSYYDAFENLRAALSEAGNTNTSPDPAE